MQDWLEEFHGIGGVIGTAISASFLLVIGLAKPWHRVVFFQGQVGGVGF